VSGNTGGLAVTTQKPEIKQIELSRIKQDSHCFLNLFYPARVKNCLARTKLEQPVLCCSSIWLLSCQ